MKEVGAMEPKKKRVATEEDEEDRISALPDALLHHIFSSMDMVDIVRTCVLAKRWRYLWTSHPYLTFNFNQYPNLVRNNCYHSVSLAFINFVNQVLLRRDSLPVIKFCHESDYSVETQPEILLGAVESWISYAAKHQVQDLQLLICCRGRNTLRIPDCFYRCETLTTLKLDSYGSNIRLPTSFRLPSLKSLHLENFYDFNERIFSGCPNLEALELWNVDFCSTRRFCICAHNLKILDIFHERGWDVSFGDCEVMICAPKLIKFKFDGNEPFALCATKNLASLDQVKIYVDKPDYIYESDDQLAGPPTAFEPNDPDRKHAFRLLAMLNHFCDAKAITLSSSVIQYLSVITSSLKDRRSPFSSLKCLKVKEDSMSSLEKVSIPDLILNYFFKKNEVVRKLKTSEGAVELMLAA